MIKPNELRQLADRFSEGWHDGIKIDASDVMLLSESANELDLLQKDAERYRWLKEYCLRVVGEFKHLKYETLDEHIEGRMLWIKNQKSRALDAARTQYELFWICKLIEKFPGMSYQTARQEFSENSTQCIEMLMHDGGG